MRASLIVSLVAFFPFMGAAHAMSCMIHESEGKASLCYYKSADGRCMQFGPVCQTKVISAPAIKLIKQVAVQVTAQGIKK